LSIYKEKHVSEAIVLVGNKQPGDIKKKESIWIRLPGVLPLKRILSRRDFEGQMAKLVNSALGHESENLPRGSEEYVRLAKMAEDAITKYCSDWSVDRRNLEAQIPAIRKLNSLATPAPSAVPKATPGVILGAIVVVAVGLFSLGAASGLFSAGFHIVVNHLVR
jgi:hypothetical protein